MNIRLDRPTSNSIILNPNLKKQNFVFEKVTTGTGRLIYLFTGEVHCLHIKIILYHDTIVKFCLKTEKAKA